MEPGTERTVVSQQDLLVLKIPLLYSTVSCAVTVCFCTGGAGRCTGVCV